VTDAAFSRMRKHNQENFFYRCKCYSAMVQFFLASQALTLIRAEYLVNITCRQKFMVVGLKQTFINLQASFRNHVNKKIYFYIIGTKITKN
jgi:hypothetical protein